MPSPQPLISDEPSAPSPLVVDAVADSLSARWCRAEALLTGRQRQVVLSYAVTRSVSETAMLLDVTQSRVYAIFVQVGRRLRLPPAVVRAALRRGDFGSIGDTVMPTKTRVASARPDPSKAR
jgi:hypothetical protein